MHIRKCTIQDLDVLLQIARRTFVDAFEKDNTPEDFAVYIKEAFAKSTIAEQLRNFNSAFYFLYVKKELAGYFKINEFDAQHELKTDDTIELERIYVLEEFQGQQLGTFMITEAMRLAKEKNKKQLWLGVWEENTSAIRFYEKQGFVKFDTHPYYIGTCYSLENFSVTKPPFSSVSVSKYIPVSKPSMATVILFWPFATFPFLINAPFTL